MPVVGELKFRFSLHLLLSRWRCWCLCGSLSCWWRVFSCWSSGCSVSLCRHFRILVFTLLVRLVLNHLAQLPHLLYRKHGHPANVHVHLGFPSSVVLGLALCHHLLDKTLLLGEVCLQHVQLLLQLVNREAILCWFAAFARVHPCGECNNLLFQIVPAFIELLHAVDPHF